MSESSTGEYLQSTYNRAERCTAWLLFSLGALVLSGWGLWIGITALLTDSVPFLVKAAILTLGVGSVLLLLSVIREKLFIRRHDPFKEVEQ